MTDFKAHVLNHPDIQPVKTTLRFNGISILYKNVSVPHVSFSFYSTLRLPGVGMGIGWVGANGGHVTGTKKRKS